MFADTLRKHLSALQAELSQKQIGQLEEHFNLLNRWNKVLNLTSIEGLGAAVERHYCESIFLGMHIAKGPLRIVDLGSGAGFPGIPVAILRPECSVTLVESHQRKSVFLLEASRAMPNTRVIPGRVEQVTETFDWAISRAVSYSEIKDSLNILAPNVALLTGQECPDARSTWNSIKLPWGKQRFLWIRSFT